MIQSVGTPSHLSSAMLNCFRYSRKVAPIAVDELVQNLVNVTPDQFDQRCLTFDKRSLLELARKLFVQLRSMSYSVEQSGVVDLESSFGQETQRVSDSDALSQFSADLQCASDSGSLARVSAELKRVQSQYERALADIEKLSSVYDHAFTEITSTYERAFAMANDAIALRESDKKAMLQREITTLELERARYDAEKQALVSTHSRLRSLELDITNERLRLDQVEHEMRESSILQAREISRLTDEVCILRKKEIQSLVPLVDMMEECLTDPVSWELFVDPITLNSGHLLSRSSLIGCCTNGVFRCPITRIAIQRGPTELKTVAIEQLVEIYKKMRSELDKYAVVDA